jgi:hypothetical protein
MTSATGRRRARVARLPAPAGSGSGASLCAIRSATRAATVVRSVDADRAQRQSHWRGREQPRPLTVTLPLAVRELCVTTVCSSARRRPGGPGTTLFQIPAPSAMPPLPVAVAELSRCHGLSGWLGSGRSSRGRSGARGCLQDGASARAAQCCRWRSRTPIRAGDLSGRRHRRRSRAAAPHAAR